VTPQFLLEGAVYALEQCGRLLHDAILLYRSGSYATAVAVAAFAREELGRWKKLLALRNEVIGGKILTIQSVKASTKNHVRNQEYGMLSITLTGQDDPKAAELIRSRGSDEWFKIMKEHLPKERHQNRKSALYVEPLSANLWNRPANTISRSFAERVLTDVANDYSLQYGQRYITGEDPILRHLDKELFSALEQWSERPTLRQPQWPHLPDK
jgi:AbiV family abortive infection protein